MIHPYYIKAAIGLSAGVAASIVILARWKQLHKADRYIALLVVCGCSTDIGSFILARTVGNNYAIFHLYATVSLALGCRYFSSSIPALAKRRLGTWLTDAGVILALANAYFLQPLAAFNSYFLLVEGGIMILLSLFSFYSILMKEDEVVPYPYTIFWVSIIMLLYWSLSVAGFGLYQYLLWSPIINNVLYASGVLLYISLAVVFSRYRKLIPSGA